MHKLFYIGVKAIICQDGKCLILKKIGTNKSFWDIPGGRMEAGESVLNALKRELLEELPGIGAFEVETLLDVYPLPLDISGGGLMFVTFKIHAEPFEITLSPEHSEYRWVTRADLEELKKDLSIPIDYHYGALIKALS